MRLFLFTSFLFLFCEFASAQIILTHNTSDDFQGTSIYGCSDCCLRWARVFDLADFGVENELRIDSGTTAFRVLDVNGIHYQYNFYLVDENFPSTFDEENLIGSSQEAFAYSSNSHLEWSLAFDEPVIIPAGTEKILVEIKQTQGEVVFMSGTPEDTAVSWFKSDAGGCNPSSYTTTDDLNRHDARFYIKVLGEDVLSISSNENPTISISPNPVIDNLDVNYSGKLKNISVFDINGSKIDDFNPTIRNIPIQNYARGMYFLSLENIQGDLEVMKFIKI